MSNRCSVFFSLDERPFHQGLTKSIGRRNRNNFFKISLKFDDSSTISPLYLPNYSDVYLQHYFGISRAMDRRASILRIRNRKKLFSDFKKQALKFYKISVKHTGACKIYSASARHHRDCKGIKEKN